MTVWLGLLLAGVSGALSFVWGLIEARLYHSRVHTLRVLPKGSPEIKILQVSDLHFRPTQRRMAAFLRGLDSETFDMVFATGDLLGDPHSVDEVVALLNGLSGTYGRFFVLGSADHYAPEFKNYLDYFRGKRKLGTRRNPTGRFTHSLVSSGWTDLTNTGLLVEIRGMTIQITGLDDPYMGRDDRSLLRRDPEADLSILVVHDPAPYRDAGEAGYDLVVSGHTHGGQVRMPVIGALVTNSELPRQRAKWQSSLAGGGTLFVSPGLGTGRYAPFRFLSRPEASILVLNEKP